MGSWPSDVRLLQGSFVVACCSLSDLTTAPLAAVDRHSLPGSGGHANVSPRRAVELHRPVPARLRPALDPPGPAVVAGAGDLHGATAEVEGHRAPIARSSPVV